jgi:hypothetical protein
MNHFRILHNGDIRNGSPHWWVHVNEEGRFYGEILTKTTGRLLQDDFKLQNIQPFFDIPVELARQQLTVHPHHEEIILSLVTSPGERLCSFLLSDVPKNSDLRKVVEEVVEKVAALANKSGKP